MINWIKNKLHIHRFSKPIASQYWTFSTRKIIFECKCGKREMRDVYKNFGDAFPIETTLFITSKEMKELLNGNGVIKNNHYEIT